MAYLLDTHTLIWQLNEPEKLSNAVRDIISYSSEDILVSAVSLWEIAIKTGLGRLQLNISFKEMYTALQEHHIYILDIHLVHLDFYKTLPFIHKDPFDRMLVAQALSDDLEILTKDTVIQQYSVKTIW